MGSTGDAISGPGIFFVNSKIARGDLIDEKLFFKWYDEDHIPEIIETSGMKSAIRFRDVDPKAEMPYLSLYAMKDIAFTQSEEFQKIKVHSPLLPGDNSIYDLADFDVRVYRLVQVYEPKGPRKGETNSIIVAQMELGSEVSDEEYNKFYDDEHHAAVGQYPGFVRATRLKLVYWRNSAQSKALKGEEGTAAEEPARPPKWLAIHEFADEKVDMQELFKYGASKWTDRVVGDCKVMKAPMFQVLHRAGEADFFHGFKP